MPRDHFVPQFYLRHFGHTEKQIHTTRLRPYRFIPSAAIRGQCQSNRFYEDDAGLERHILESERLYAALLRSVISERDLSESNEQSLKCFAAELYIRTRKTAEHMKVFPKHMACEVLQTAIDCGELPPVPGGQKLEDVIDLAGVPRFAMRFGGEILLELLTMKAKLLAAADGARFITSDQPVCLSNQFCASVEKDYGTAGFSLAGLQMVLPLSPKLCFFCFDPGVYKVGNRRDRVVALQEEDVAVVNCLQVQSAENCLYFQEASQEHAVERLVERFSHLRAPVEDTLRELEIDGHTVLHLRHPSVRLPRPWRFCRQRKHIKARPGERRSEAWSGFLMELFDDIEKNPSGGDFPARIARLLGGKRHHAG